ncbi:uncharacterized protein LOC116219039 [Clupea harengus]|uniref:Uncharacterized protein LOC116219039 n=1 Tax=Clupea harengus TaxID=7950 RepID=A0A6P8EZG1_CLUHA|nr:uncharacterized protein LOC116219039 [Clupea harengus]
MYDAMVLITTLKETCSEIDQDVASALSSNVDTVSSTAISTLGNSSTGFSTGQLTGTSATVIFSSLSVLSTVVGWNQGQALTLVQKLISSGSFTITSSQDIQTLGTLITGLPSTIISSISSAEILTASQSSAVVSNLITAPTIVQQTFVNQIISVDTSVGSILTNVPDRLASQIPRDFLQGFSQTTETVTKLNQKTWTVNQRNDAIKSIYGNSYSV